MLCINNQWLAGRGESIQLHDPATGEISKHYHAADTSQVSDAIIAAGHAFTAWSTLPLASRIDILQRYARQLDKQQATLATLIAEETGKPLWEAKTEITAMINKVTISIDAYHTRTGIAQSALATNVTLTTQHRPIGVFAVLGPFNFPAHLPNGHIVPALLAGNTLVFKPSEYTPRIAIAMLEAWEAAGLPAGVLNLVLGRAEVGQCLTQDARIDGVLFTGSYQTGQRLHQFYAGQPEKMLALEMGGNNPLIVRDVNDLQAAAYYTIQSAYLTAGQRCTCARRLIIADDAKGAAFLDVLQQRMRSIRVGDWRQDPNIFMGPVITAATAQSLLKTQENFQQQGAMVLQPMRLMKENTGLLTPGLLDVTGVANRPDKEFFGPLLQVIRVADFAAALSEANATRFGLAAGLLSDNASYYTQFANTIRAGIISWNRPTNGASSAAPFGGIGFSGNHRPSAYYAADYCAYPMVSTTAPQLTMPETLTPGL